MAYDVTKTNGERLTIVPDRTVDTTTSLKLIGKNYAGYGELMAENLVGLLENFSSVNAPANPVEGQLWWDSQNKVLKVRSSSTVWTPVSGLSKFKTITNADYVVLSEDHQSLVRIDSTVDRTVTLPATADIPVGTIVTLAQVNSGKITVTGATGVTVNTASGFRTYQPFERIVAIKVAVSVWELDVRLASINEQLVGPYTVAPGVPFDVMVIGAAPLSPVSWSGSSTGSATLNSNGTGGFFGLNIGTAGTYSWTFTFGATGHQRTYSIIVGTGIGDTYNEVISGPSTVPINQSFTLSISGAKPNSTFTYKNPGDPTIRGPVTLDAQGRASFTIPAGTFTATGTYTYELTFAGSGNVKTYTVVVTPASTGNEVVTGPSTVPINQSFVISVSGGTSSGSFTYVNPGDPTVRGPVALDAQGRASFTIPAGTFSAPGTYTYTLTFNTGTVRTYTVTITAVSFNPTVTGPSTSPINQAFTITIGNGQPNGSFTYTNPGDPTVRGPVSLNGSGGATFTIPAGTFLSTGTYTYTLTFNTGQVRTYTVTITPASGVTPTPSSSFNPIFSGPQSILVGQAFTLTVTNGQPNGSFTYTNPGDPTVRGPVQLNGSGAATFSIPAGTFTAPGTYSYTATFNTGQVRTYTLTVLASITPTPASTLNPQFFGPATIQAGQGFTLSVAGGQANGSFTYTNPGDPTVRGPVTLSASGAASFSIPAGTFTAPGTYTYTATFNTGQVRTYTLTVLGSSPSPSPTPGSGPSISGPQSITSDQSFTVTVSGGPASGTFTYTVNSGSASSPVSLNSSGGASFTIPGGTFTSPGTYTLVATFSNSTTATYVLTVYSAGSPTPAPTPGSYNEQVPQTVTLESPSDIFTINITGASPNGTFTYNVNGGAESSPISLTSNGTKTQTFPGNLFTPGTYLITWTFVDTGNTRTTTITVKFDEQVTSAVNANSADPVTINITGGAPNTTFGYSGSASGGPLTLDGSGNYSQTFSGGTFPPGTYTYVWTFDETGHTRTTVVTIT